MGKHSTVGFRSGPWCRLMMTCLMNALIAGQSATAAEVGPNDFKISAAPGAASYFRPAVAHNATDGEYLVVYPKLDMNPTIPSADWDQEIFGHFVNADGTLQGSEFQISNMPVARCWAEYPSVAWDSVNNRYLVVWEGERIYDEDEIFGRLYDNDGADVMGQFRISTNGTDGATNFDAVSPDVAFSATSQQYLVVWKADATAGEEEVYQRRVSSSGTLVDAADVRISTVGPDGSGTYDAHFPRVAWSSGQNEFLVVWVADEVNNDFEVFAQFIDGASGAQIGGDDLQLTSLGDGSADYDANRNQGQVAIAHNAVDDEFLIVWAGDDSKDGRLDNEIDVSGQLVSASSRAATGPDDFRITAVGDAGFNHAEYPRVAWSAAQHRYLVVMQVANSGDGMVSGEEEMGYRAVTALGVPVGSGHILLSDMGGIGNGSYDCYFGDVAHNPTLGEFMVTWYGDELGETIQHVYGQRLDADLVPVNLSRFSVE